MTFQTLIKTAPQIVKDKLEQLKSLRERPDYHPEPSTFHHIEIVTNRLIPTGDMDLILSGILHDICKLDTAKMNEKTGWPTSPGHDQAAFDLIFSSSSIQDWIRDNGGDEVNVALICKGHMRFHQLGDMRPFKREDQIQEWTDLGIFDKLQIFGAADNMLKEFNMNTIKTSIN